MRAGYRRTAAAWAGAFALASASACSAGSTPASRQPAATVAPTSTAPAPTVAPEAVHANELGAVPVLMYHQLLARPRSDYDQTPAQFRAELERLYAAGYRTVTAADLVAGTIDIPAGTSPMVLTFDDSTTSQYGELAGGGVDPTTAVGILLAVAARHGEERPVATFYVNAAPFAGKDSYLAHLHALGMEIGDHTATHANLRQLDDTGVQRELVQGLAVINGQLPGVPVTTMALPYGTHPRQSRLAHHGVWMGRGYDFHGVLLVGSNPAKSPYSKGFDALAVPRIRSGLRTGDQTFTSTYWLPRLQRTRYVSDGNPEVISFPRSELAALNPRFTARARPY